MHPGHDGLARHWAVDGVGPHMSCTGSSGGRVFVYSKPLGEVNSVKNTTMNIWLNDGVSQQYKTTCLGL